MSMQKTVEVYGIPFEVEFEGTPFIPASRTGHPDTWTPASGGEADILTITHEGADFTDMLADCVVTKILEDLTQYLCSGQAEEEAKAAIAEARKEREYG